MRLIKKKNVEIVYSAMKSYYEKRYHTKRVDWIKPLSFKEIENLLKPMNKRCIYRHLYTMMMIEKPPRVIKQGKGEYSIDFVVEHINERQKVIPRVILPISSYKEINGENPIFNSQERYEVLSHILEWRLKTHNQRDVAQAEADAWTISFIDALSYDAKTNGAPIKIRRNRLVSTGEKVGIDAFIFRKAMEIMLELLESLDVQSFRKEDILGDANIAVTITFNPAAFLDALERNKEIAESIIRPTGKKFQWKDRKRVFPEFFEDQPRKFSLFSEDAVKGLRKLGYKGTPQKILDNLLKDVVKSLGEDKG